MNFVCVSATNHESGDHSMIFNGLFGLVSECQHGLCITLERDIIDRIPRMMGMMS